MIPRTVWDALETWAEKRPDQVAVWVSERSLTFSELREAAALYGSELHQRGARPGDRLVVWCPTSLGSLVAFFACAYSRMIFAPVNTRLTFREAKAILDRLEPSVLLIGSTSTSRDPIAGSCQWVASRQSATPDVWAEDGAVAAELGIPSTPLEHLIERARANVARHRTTASPAVRPAYDDSFLIQMTSGSTAAPKAVLLGQGQCIRMGYELAVRFDMHPSDRYFICNPIHHVGSTNFGLLTALSHGGGFYSLREFAGDEAVAAIRANSCTHHHGIEAHYLYELRSPLIKGGLPSVRVASAHAEMALRVMEAFGPLVTISVYGSSETTASPFATDHADPLEKRLTTDGRPLPEVEARIVDPGTGTTVPAGVVGELYIRGWCVMQGYFRDPAATEACIDADGWYHTGDMASMAASGDLKFFARMKDFIRVGGENVAAAEIEGVLRSHQTVRLAAVVPVPHDVLGQVPVAFVVDEDGSAPASPDELVRYCAERLARFKVPRLIHKISLDQLPMTGPGKVKKGDLQKLAVRLADGGAHSGEDGGAPG